MFRAGCVCLSVAVLSLIGVRSPQAADKVRLGLPAIYTSYMVAVAADELGVYKEKNLDVEITMYRGGGAAFESLAAGECDILATNAASVGILQKKNIGVKVFARSGPGAPVGWYLAVPSNSPIKSPADLDGKTVGITTSGTITEMLARYAAWKGHAQIRVAPVGGAGMVPALQSAAIDSAVVWPPISFQLLNSNDFRSVFDFGKEAGSIGLDMYAASTELIEKRPDVLQRWTDAIAKTLVYMQKNEDWALKFLAKATGEKDPKVNQMSYDVMIRQYEPSLAFEPKWIESSVDIAKLVGIEGLPPTENLFTTKFVPANPN